MKELERIVEKTEELLGISSGAWDMVDPVLIASAILKSAKYAQSKREWAGLTDEEMRQVCYEIFSYDPYAIARVIEAKLKEKNG